MAAGLAVDISLLGDKALEAQLAQLEAKVQRKFVRSALTKAMHPILADAKAMCPYSTKRRWPGKHLRDTLKSRVIPKAVVQDIAGKGAWGRWIIPGTREELGIPAKDPYYHPSALEFGKRPEGMGTKVKGAKKGQLRFNREQISTMAGSARPFMRPAFDKNKSRTIRNVRRWIWADVRQAVRTGPGNVVRAVRVV